MIICRMQCLGKLLMWKELPIGRTSVSGSVLSHPHRVSVIIHQRVLLAVCCHRPLLNVILRGSVNDQVRGYLTQLVSTCRSDSELLSSPLSSCLQLRGKLTVWLAELFTVR